MWLLKKMTLNENRRNESMDDVIDRVSADLPYSYENNKYANIIVYIS
jgi:hypothetical protein